MDINRAINSNLIKPSNIKKTFLVNTKKLIFSTLIIFVLGVLLFLTNNFTSSDKIYSYYFIIIYVISFFAIWNVTNKKITPFVLFYLTFGLFIGGRFIAVAFSPYYENLWRPTLFMKNYFISNNLKSETISHILEFIGFISLGYIIIKQKKSNIIKKKSFFDFNERELKTINIILKYVFPIFFITTIYGDLLAIKTALSEGYYSLYEGQGSTEGGGLLSSLFSSFFSICFGIALAVGDPSNRKKFIILFVLDACLIMFIGSRGGFGASALLLLWLYSQSHNISLKRLILYGFFSLIALLVIFSFTIRGEEKGFNLNNFNFVLSTFFYGQGVTMIVFNTIKFVPHFPTLSYLTAVFPFAIPIYRIISGTRPPSYEFSFSNYFAKTINSELYFSGQGMGWTILGDIYLFSFGSMIFFCLLALLLGIGFAWVENKAQYNNFWKIFLYSFITLIVILPRGSIMRILPKIVPFALYFSIFILIIRIFIQLNDKGILKKNIYSK